MTKNTPSQDLRAKIAAIKTTAEPLRAQREVVSRRIERERLEARELSRQILAIEAPLQVLHMDLLRAEKLAGREVITLQQG